MEVGRECRTFVSQIIKEGVDLGHSGSQTQLSASPEEGSVEADVTALEEGEKSVNFLQRRDIFDKGDEGVSHGHVMGIGFVNEADGRLRVDGMI